MTRPDWRRDGDEFSYTWKETGVAIGLTAIREGRDGLMAEITVEAGEQTVKPDHLHWSSLNLSSTSARKTIASHLHSRYELADWPGMLEQACVITAREFRRGEPVVRLADEPVDRSQPRYLFEPFLPLGEPAVFFADGGSLKSLLALSIAVCVATMHPLTGTRSLLGPSRMEDVLFVDWETNASEQAERLQEVSAGLGVPVPRNIHYKRLYRSLPDEASTLRADVSRLGVGLVVVDSIAAACGDEPESAAVISRFFNSLRSLDRPGERLTKLVISHVSKAGADQKNGAARPFGSAFVQNYARSVWEIRRSDDGGENEVSIGLYHRKVNRGKLHKPMALTATFEEQRVRWNQGELKADSDLAAHTSLSYHLREALKQGARDVSDLSEELGAQPDTVYKTLRRMSDVRQLEPGKRGQSSVWGLKAS